LFFFAVAVIAWFREAVLLGAAIGAFTRAVIVEHR
jgi:hypothetical protein